MLPHRPRRMESGSTFGDDRAHGLALKRGEVESRDRAEEVHRAKSIEVVTGTADHVGEHARLGVGEGVCDVRVTLNLRPDVFLDSSTAVFDDFLKLVDDDCNTPFGARRGMLNAVKSVREEQTTGTTAWRAGQRHGPPSDRVERGSGADDAEELGDCFCRAIDRWAEPPHRVRSKSLGEISDGGKACAS